jgi:hypothetical protein
LNKWISYFVFLLLLRQEYRRRIIHSHSAHPAYILITFFGCVLSRRPVGLLVSSSVVHKFLSLTPAHW